MKYAIVLFAGLIFGLAATIYMNLYEVKKYKLAEHISAKNIFIPVSKKRMIYNIIAVLAVMAIGFIIRKVYDTDSMVHQVKLQFLISVLFALAFIDYRYKIVPNKVLLAALIMRIPFLIGEFFVYSIDGFIEILKAVGFGVLIYGVFFLVCALFSKGGIGMGDLKLFLIIAIYQGLEYSITSIFLSLLLCFIVSLVLLILKKKKVKDTLPMVPCILLGTYISIALTGM